MLLLSQLASCAQNHESKSYAQEDAIDELSPEEATKLAAAVPKGTYYLSTPEYNAVRLKLRISAWQAAANVIAYEVALGSIEAKDEPAVQAYLINHRLIVDGAYVFPDTRHKNGLALSGYYVDGITGKVEVRENEDMVHGSDMKKRGWTSWSFN
jgi:hypothetical protein